jgi:hypothetical protein
MEMLRRLFGMDEPERQQPRGMAQRRELSPDEQAVDRYRYLLRTAPPETIEEAHAEAFSKLTPDQRQLVLQELDTTLTPAERASGVAYDEEPRSLARLATRAEMRQPGTLERTWTGMPAMAGPGGMGMGMGGFMMSSFMGTFAGVMVGSMVADAFLGNSGYDQGSADGQGAGDSQGDAGFEGGDMADAGAGDAGGFGDFGGGFGDFGGGDFGGGDF